jgi:LCP family protein required for cell wall assembly
VPTIDSPNDDVLNVVLVGAATFNDANVGLTDSLHLLSFNPRTRHVALIGLPRDLYVYVPHADTMAKLNQAYALGAVSIGGATALKQTLLYNLGVHVDYYVRLNFNGFRRLIQQLGGVTLSVDCPIQDWRLKSPELDVDNPDHWEMFTLENGVHHMDADLALWYARSRRTTLETDRGRRQHDLLRAIWRELRQQDLLATLPALWETWTRYIETDIALNDALAWLPTFVQLETSDIRYETFTLNREVRNAYTTDRDRRFIFLPDHEAIADLLRAALFPSDQELRERAPLVGIVNVSGVADYGRVAAERLELEGFRTVILSERASPRLWNLIIDYTGQEKGNPIDRLRRALATTPEGVRQEPTPTREMDYKVYLGANYPYYACTRPILPPTTPTPPEG